MNALLEVHDLRVSFDTEYGDVAAVDGASFRVDEGETLGVVGEAGAGKTTALSAIVRKVKRPGRIVGGRIAFRGHDLLALSEDEMKEIRGEKIGLIAPNPHTVLNPLARVGDQIAAYAEANLGLSEVEAHERAVHMLEAMGIPDPERRAKAYPHELSGGMAQRVVCAIGFIGSPDLLLADEFTFGLDVTIQAQVLELIRKQMMERPDTAVVIATRDLGIAANYCERVAVMQEGQIVELADVEELWGDPKHPHTRRLLSAAKLEHPDTADDGQAPPRDPQEESEQ
jgi:ABC-type dipeptide/oligopeptide/nickel transport system ATPase component